MHYDEEYVSKLFKDKNIKVTIITKEKNLDLIEGANEIKHNPNIKTNLAFIDDTIVYYGSINLLIPYNTNSTILRLNDSSLVDDMKKDLE